MKRIDLKRTKIKRAVSSIAKGTKRSVGGKNKPSRRITKPKKKVSKAQKARELWGQYGLEVPQYIRYAGLAGILWWLTSQYVRQEEFKKYGGKCVDNCGVEILDWRDADCGHFRSASHLSTRFLRKNLALQRKYCNSPNGGNGNQYDFGLEIDRRYGQGTSDELTELSKRKTDPFPKSWYHEEILKIQALLETV